jgi:hypothetical protein
MKNIVLTLVTVLTFGVAINAQTDSAKAAPVMNEKFVKAMSAAIAPLDTAQTLETLVDMCNKIERIADKEKNEWLPNYYVALLQVQMTYRERDQDKRSAILKKAEGFITKADSMMPNHSEILCVHSMVLYAKIMLNPMTNGQLYGPRATMLLEKSKVLDPENPRPVMNEGLTKYYAPPMWGGDKAKGMELMKLAGEKFVTFKAVSAIHPSWGKNQNRVMLEMMAKEGGK